ncbi:hypothetical protein BD770DRAFT_32463 [Pilaira anomala]|nr:hypothetical protein BD770DRAFT_32463 [Pilaira anomala]
MSVITNDSCFENNLHQPSLIYPSLINKQQQQQQQKTQEDSKQTCIHFVSRLIKLRSELRSPLYMRQQSSISGGHSLRPSISRVQSLPSLYIPDEHPYIHHLDDCDESEIQSPIEISPTHRRTLHTGPKAIRNGLALPPKQDFFLNENSNHSINNNNNNNNNHLITKRSISLHNILTNDHKSLSSSRPIITNRFESQLYYNHSPSQNNLNKLQLLQRQQQQMQQHQQQQQEYKKGDDDEKKGNCCCTCKKNILPITPPPVPTSSLSHETTTKSLFNSMSSDSEDDDDESIVFHPKKTVIRRRAATTTAFFVTISPSSAAAASVAKGRRCNKRRSQQTISSLT